MNDYHFIERQATIVSHEVDQFGRIKPFVLLNIAQEAAYAHSKILGFGYDTLTSLNLAWVLSRLKVEIERTPCWGETITIRTWHKRQDRAFSLRDYLIFGEGGELLVRMTSSWLIMNVATRRIHRVETLLKENNMIDFNSLQSDAIAEPAPKIDSLELSGEAVEPHRVRYSDLDLNRHTNNAKYVEWAVDRVPQQMDQSLSLKGFCVNFNLESTHGDVIEMRCATKHSDDQQVVTLDGCRDQSSIFATRFVYQL